MDREDVWYRDDDQSLLKTYDVRTGTSETVRFFDYLIEAPNWTPDGKALVFNSNGLIWRYELEDGTLTRVETDFVNQCNNDHVLSPDGKMIAVSHATKEDGQSRIYTVPMTGGVPRLITPLAPSYLHGWSPDGKTLAYCAERNGDPADGRARPERRERIRQRRGVHLVQLRTERSHAGVPDEGGRIGTGTDDVRH